MINKRFKKSEINIAGYFDVLNLSTIPANTSIEVNPHGEKLLKFFVVRVDRKAKGYKSIPKRYRMVAEALKLERFFVAYDENYFVMVDDKNNILDICLFK